MAAKFAFFEDLEVAIGLCRQPKTIPISVMQCKVAAG